MSLPGAQTYRTLYCVAPPVEVGAEAQVLRVVGYPDISFREQLAELRAHFRLRLAANVAPLSVSIFVLTYAAAILAAIDAALSPTSSLGHLPSNRLSDKLSTRIGRVRWGAWSGLVAQ